MIWLTWRQHRKQLLYTAIGLAVLAAVIVPTGLAMRGDFDRDGLGACLGVETDTCAHKMSLFNDTWVTMGNIGVLLLFLPLLLGLFWGAPVVAREVEHGTHRLVWTQGISRLRWAAAKFGFAGLAALAFSVLYGLGVSWWLSPLNSTGQRTRFDPFMFDMQGIAPVGYTLFAVALGIAAGTIWKRVLPSMGVALAGFVVVRVVLAVLARPHYETPAERTFPVQGGQPGDQITANWVLDEGIRDASGKMVAPGASAFCPAGAVGPSGRPCGADLGLTPGSYNWQLYQPADRFWTFQTIEAGIFVVLAAALLFLAISRIRRIA
ncbi:ABC transporter permease subunit [Amycolatopsis sp. K13G38]|uniref:ABC transporter permease subunit n=1 Tax=Amycolatopsis acididurans TaxID=2724524 RepID=A0ABX1J991_9PSEU|nr:ABC transporter permease subunit [Amycolatopsis acididurans]NKQ56249.1 ABC transporter permease subunit [Amycolatopsis acididurans]